MFFLKHFLLTHKTDSAKKFTGLLFHVWLIIHNINVVYDYNLCSSTNTLNRFKIYIFCFLTCDTKLVWIVTQGSSSLTVGQWKSHLPMPVFLCMCSSEYIYKSGPVHRAWWYLLLEVHTLPVEYNNGYC